MIPVVVTGAGGFLGQPLVRLLRAQGYEVTGLGRISRPGAEETVDHEVDLSRPGSIDAWLTPRTWLFHLAGSADVRLSVASPAEDFAGNLAMTFRILESVREAGCRMVFPSSGSVYDSAAPDPFREDTALRPSSPYGAAKMASEGYCFAFHKSYGVDVRIARIFSVFGPGMRRFAIHDFYHRLLEQPEKLVVRGDGGQTRDYLYVDDVARAMEIIMANGNPGAVYNIASGQARSMLEVAKAVMMAMGLADSELDADGETFHGELYHMSAAVRAIAELGFRPLTEFQKGMRETVNDLKHRSKPSIVSQQ